MTDHTGDALVGITLVDRVAVALRDHHHAISDQIDGMTAQELWRSLSQAAIDAMPEPIDYAIFPLGIDNGTRWHPEKALAAAEQDRRKGRNVVAVALVPIDLPQAES